MIMVAQEQEREAELLRPRKVGPYVVAADGEDRCVEVRKPGEIVTQTAHLFRAPWTPVGRVEGHHRRSRPKHLAQHDGNGGDRVPCCIPERNCRGWVPDLKVLRGQSAREQHRKPYDERAHGHEAQNTARTAEMQRRSPSERSIASPRAAGYIANHAAEGTSAHVYPDDRGPTRVRGGCHGSSPSSLLGNVDGRSGQRP